MAPEEGGEEFIQRGVVTWEGGVPVLSQVPMLAKRQFEDLAVAAASREYEVRPDVEDDARFKGMTNAEVLFIRLAESAARGDNDSANKLLDRILGKPKFSGEVKTISASYEDLLRQMAAEDRGGGPAPIDAETVEAADDEPDYGSII